MPIIAQQNDVFQVRIVGRIEGQETNNVWHFKCASGAGDDDVLTHLILVLAACFITNLLPVLSSAWALESIKFKKVTPQLGQEVVAIPVGAGAGGTSGQQLPSFCSALVSIRTQTGGRSHRGRAYFAGIPEAATVGSHFDTTGPFWAGLVAFLNCVVQNFIIGDPPGDHAWQMMVYSRKLGGAAFPYGANGYTPMSELVPVQQLATTRSRKVGRGS